MISLIDQQDTLKVDEEIIRIFLHTCKKSLKTLSKRRNVVTCYPSYFSKYSKFTNIIQQEKLNQLTNDLQFPEMHKPDIEELHDCKRHLMCKHYWQGQDDQT